jgi:hypothetical protein
VNVYPLERRESKIFDSLLFTICLWKNLDYFAFTWHWVHPVGPAGLLAFFASSWQPLQVL